MRPWSRVLSDPISNLNTNILSPQDWEQASPEVKGLFLTAARMIGFRFVMTRLRVPTQLSLSNRTPGRLLVEHTWRNIGVAPCYGNYALEFTVHDNSGKVVAAQRLEGTFETSLEAAGGHLALERGTNATTTEIDLWLDSVELELLEAP